MAQKTKLFLGKISDTDVWQGSENTSFAKPINL